MSNTEKTEAGTGAEVPVAQAGVSAGTLLRQAREASGLHIAALAVSMKVPVKKLEALESDQLDLLPDAVFARALAGSMCRALKIDPAPVLERLPGSKKVSLTLESRAANQPFTTSGHQGSNTSSMKLGKTAIFTVMALLLGVVLVLFVPDLENSKKSADTTTEVVDPHFPSEADKPPLEELITPSGTLLPTESANVPASAPALAVSAAVVPAAPPVPVAPVVVPSVVPLAPTPAVSAPQAQKSAPVGNVLPVPKLEPSSAPAAVSANPVVVFKVRGSSWVEVTDAKGLVQLRRTMAEGESAGAAGTLPLVVVIGRVDMTDVTVRGKPFDVSKVALGNVARFEVK